MPLTSLCWQFSISAPMECEVTSSILCSVKPTFMTYFFTLQCWNNALLSALFKPIFVCAQEPGCLLNLVCSSHILAGSSLMILDNKNFFIVIY